MKKAFTLVEVVILLVIFVMVAMLVIPLSIDDTVQARNISKWKQVHNDFKNIPTSVKTFSDRPMGLQDFVTALVKVHPLNNVTSYKIKYLNGDTPTEDYIFTEKYNTDSGASLAFKWLNIPKTDIVTNRQILGFLMYDVNGKQGPNVWGKDIFGMNIYADTIEPFGLHVSPEEVEFDCSRQGTGLYCSTYYLNGGSF